AKHSSTGCHDTHFTSALCSCMTATVSKLLSPSSRSSQIQIDLSREHVASNIPEGDHDTDLTSLSWPSRSTANRHSSSSSSLSVPSWSASPLSGPSAQFLGPPSSCP